MRLPAPYFHDETAGVTIYHGDCRDVLPTLQPASCDLVITDPPYGVNWESGWRSDGFGRIANDDGTLDMAPILAMILRVLRPYRHIYVFGPATFDGLPVGGQCELIWDKGSVGMGDLTAPWGTSHERIAFGTHQPKHVKSREQKGSLAARLRRGSVLTVPRVPMGLMNHPTEKPQLLLRQLIESSSVIGELVIDPFMGGGSLLEAARTEGRRAIGIDVDEANCERAALRLAQSVLPLEVA